MALVSVAPVPSISIHRLHIDSLRHAQEESNLAAATIETVRLELSTPVQFVKRVGERVASGLTERGIVTVEDLLYHLPFRYEDRLHPKPLSLYQPGDMASLVGEVRGAVLLRTRSGPIFEVTVGIAPSSDGVAPASAGAASLAATVRRAPLPAPGTAGGTDGDYVSAEGYSANAEGSVTAEGSSATSEGAITAERYSANAEGSITAEGSSATAEGSTTLQGLLRAPSGVAETIKCMWFHGAYLKDKIRPGQKIALYGKLEASRSGSSGLSGAAGLVTSLRSGGSRFKMVQPTFEILPDASASGEDAEFTMLEMGRIVPVYESLGGTTPWGAKLTSRWMRRVMWSIFRELAESGVEAEETLPRALLQRLQLPARMAALQALHFPPAGTAMTALMAARTPAHRRLIFEEFWYLELGLELKRRSLRNRQGTVFRTDDSVRQALKNVLPFKPTAAQKRVLGEIVADMREPRPMRRLLQGDVGSGKTIVAFQAALVAIENGFQVAMMAPTEILATQHFLSARKLLAEKISPRSSRPYRIALLTGSLDDRTKREVRGRLFRGEIDLVIGTHALVEEKVDFDNLGLVIVDEQHRFGVQQRFQLMRKPGAGGIATEPDVLVMTATPIPRTLALTVYGDLEASVLDELPPGRSPVVTRRVPDERAEEVWEFVRKQVSAGRQAFLVYPIIEGERDDQPELDFASEPEEAATASVASTPTQQITGAGARVARTLAPAKYPALQLRAERVSGQAPLAEAPGKSVQPTGRTRGQVPGRARRTGTTDATVRLRSTVKLRSATETFEELRQGALSGLRLGLLHGRMSADDKDVTMARFQRGEIDVLVSTTVIEVGVDVPNASVMVIGHAERFGLAQMHQLRGRVGRGATRSYCILLTGPRVSGEADQRLEAMVRTQNGFELAELDLVQRGPGEFFGTRQAGLPELRVASLTRDRDLLELAKTEAARFAETPEPGISSSEIDGVWSRLRNQWQRRYGLVEA